MRTLLLLIALWGGASVGFLRHWRRDHAWAHQDDQLRALLAGRVVPAPRRAPDDQPVVVEH